MQLQSGIFEEETQLSPGGKRAKEMEFVNAGEHYATSKNLIVYFGGNAYLVEICWSLS